jgi:hypothetical protein
MAIKKWQTYWQRNCYSSFKDQRYNKSAKSKANSKTWSTLIGFSGLVNWNWWGSDPECIPKDVKEVEQQHT